MNNLNVINGSGKYINDCVDRCLEAAIKWYGDKYEDIIVDTIHRVNFYNWQDNQSFSDVKREILGSSYIEGSSIKDGMNEQMNKGFYFVNTTNGKYDKIVVCQEEKLRHDYNVLVHELYGHAVMGNVDEVIYLNNEEVIRNGIRLFSSKSKHILNNWANEGFVEYSAENISRMAGVSIDKKTMYNYVLTMRLAALAIDIIGREKVFDSLILNEGIFKDEYNKGLEYDEWKISLPVSCGSHMTGEKTTACVLCGDRKTISYEAAEEHQYGEWKTTPATCETDGERVRVCQNCQKAEKEILPATGHLYGEWKTTPATCETDGVQIRTCQTCKKTETKIVSAIGHRYGEWQTVRQATVLEEGELQRGCENPGCTSMQTRRLDRLPHYIQLNTSNMILQIKQSTTGLKVTDMAEGDRIISWKSSKPTVATVSKTGKIAAKKVGTTIITVTLASGATANVKVKVQKKAVQPVSLRIACSRLKSNRITLKKGQRTTCKVTVSPFTCKTKVTFSSANPKIVKVSGNGKIIARKAGKTKITVKAGKKKKVIWVTVKKVK